LGNDAARSGKVVRKAFAEGLAPLIDILAQSISGKSIPEKSKAARRRKAVAAMATLVGALTLARAVEGTPLSDETLEAAHRELAATARP
jgi:TetR/AcrR family transcriptional repressor of nem operon